MKIRFPNPALVVAAAALLLSLGGTAVAGALITGAQIQNNTVTGLDLKNRTVKNLDIGKNTVNSLNVANGSLQKIDFAPGQLETGPAGPQGPAGPPGPPGAGGAQGAPGMSGLEIVMADSGTSSASPKTVDAACPAGKKVVGGGAHGLDANGLIALDESYPMNGTTWRARAYEIVPTALSWHLRAYAVCAAVAS